MSNRPTMSAVAKMAGVSIATVDRVLNSRTAVRDGTAERVIVAAQEIGYHATELMRQRLREQAPFRRLGFCLQKASDPFYQGFGAALKNAAACNRDVRCDARIEFMDELAPLSIADKIRAAGKQVDALAVVALDHPHVNQAILELAEMGKPVFTLLSDVSAPLRTGYIGTDNRKVGRTAGLLFARMTREVGEVGIFVGSHRYLGQETREISFRSYLREHAPSFKLLDAYSNLEDQNLAYEAVLELQASHPDLVGIYVAGGGASGVIRALREEPAGRRLTVIVNELTVDSRSALIDGIVDLVIATPLVQTAQTTVKAMLDAIEAGNRSAALLSPLPFELYTAENV
ncbi:MAG: LacI family DNA-binding transcriptional regulator [Oxalobacteraceae bacterium]|nr:LacI family DNA-binding transcriptional regulator [Oxalobacteraceae bacterium]